MIRERYVHKRTLDGGGFTICNLVDNDHGVDTLLARGFAICSPRDNFSRKLGRVISLGRATKAFKSKMNISPIVLRRATDYNDSFISIAAEFICKGIYYRQ